MFRSACLWAALGAACSSSSPVRTAIPPPQPQQLAVESCPIYGDVQNGKTCSIYDAKAQAFVDTPDPLALRAFLYDRWLDKYNNADYQEVIRHLKDPMTPADPESKWGDENEIAYWDDEGDSAGFGGTLMRSVMFRYASTRTDADYARFENWLRGQVRKFEATGMDGYLARYFYGHIDSGVQIQNGRAMAYGGDNFAIPASALPNMPALAGTPSWTGHVSIDAYSGPMNTWPLAYPLVKDKALQQQMVRQYTCFLKRMKAFHITNLSKNAELQSDLAHYLTSGVLNLDPDDPDLTKVDEVWGFYLPQYNTASASTFDATCPAHLATDASADDTIDASAGNATGRLLQFFLRQQQSDTATTMDFAYYISVRAGDALQLMSYALGAYSMTGDQEYLQWRDQMLVAKGNAQAVSRTIGAFQLPKPCRSYFRTPNVYAAHFMNSLLENNSANRDFNLLLWQKKFALKETNGLRDSLYEILSSAATGTASAGLTQAVADVSALGGAAGALDTPRRNYAIDLSVNTPPDITLQKATADEIAICSQPINILGITIPVGSPNPDQLYATPSPPVMERPPDNWIWEKDPFASARTPGDAGYQQYNGLDYSEPYWELRYFGYVPDTHYVLAWK